jgi:hypothetical protein
MASKDEQARRKALKDEYLRAERASQAAMLPMDEAQLESLLTFVDEAVERAGCDHDYAATDEWANSNGVAAAELHTGLAEFGGHCDCEIVLNVDPDEVFSRR